MNQQQEDPIPFFDWIQSALNNPDIQRGVRDTVFSIEAVAPEVTTLRTIAQSPPFHAEGPMVMHHIERMLAGLLFVTKSGSLLHIEEFASRKHWRVAIHELEEIIREQAGTLQAFVFLHDLAKAETLSFSSPSGSKGASEGFVKDARLSISALNQRYSKLLRAFEAEQKIDDPSLLAQAFYDTYNIRVHYHGHERVIMNDAFDHARNAIGDYFRLTGRDREVLALMCETHIDVLLAFSKGVDVAQLKTMKKRAKKRGLDADDVLDLQLAALLLDSVIGSLRYDQDRAYVDISPIAHFLDSEEQAFPDRKAARDDRFRIRRRKQLKRAMQKAGIDAPALINILQLPVGPERGERIAEVQKYVQLPHAPIPTEDFPTEVIEGIKKARLFYSTRKVS